MSHDEERRRAPRIAVDLECACVDTEFRLLGRRAADLSAGGLLVRAAGARVEVGARVTVSFRPPRSLHWIDAEARVVRSDGGSLGLELTALGPFEREWLAGVVERERTRPSRPRRPRADPTVKTLRLVVVD